MTPYSDIDLDQHWLRKWLVAWRYQAITWTNADSPSMRFCDTHLTPISEEVFKISVREMSLKITFIWLLPHRPGANELSHWGRVTHICDSKLTIIGLDNGLSPGRRQAIIWTNAGILLTRTIGTNFSEISSEIHAVSFKKMHLKMSSAKCRPCCLSPSVLKHGFVHPNYGINESICSRLIPPTTNDTVIAYTRKNAIYIL